MQLICAVGQLGSLIRSALDAWRKIVLPNPKIHFISGLPRSGSTLLAALLRQNPRFHAGMTSPVGALFNSLLTQFSAGSEYGPAITQAQRMRLLQGLFESYYADQQEQDVIFDTNRLWCSKMPALMELYPQAKVIACVRNVSWIMDSIERIYRPIRSRTPSSTTMTSNAIRFTAA